MSEKLELKSISEILDKSFYIPAYQRGYRWSSRQVIDLLEDIMEFSNTKKEDDFYCLQPIVVLSEKHIENEKEIVRYRVVDGQQRLTTLYLILKLFNEIEFKRPKIHYTISFETRDTSKEFLESLNIDSEISNKNIDFYFLSSNYKLIYNWFDEKLKLKSDFIQKLYSVLIECIKVIWYEIDNENEINVFTRLNIGKIPLTNAELIKAIFLINTKEENEKLLLASQWDEIEYKLQVNSFFAFVNKDFEENKEIKYPTRIEFIFDLIANKSNSEINNLQKDDERRSYYIFNELIENEDSAKEFWNEVKRYFRVFNEFYSNQEYYHLVGFLVHNGVKIEEIIKDFINNPKDKFINFMKKRIKDLVKTSKEIEELSYEHDYKFVTKILFLFNVISTINSKYSKYPFDLHKLEKWSLEHIHAQNSEDIKKKEDRVALLESQKKYVDDYLLNKIQELINKDAIEDDEFNLLEYEIFKIYSDDVDIHTIDNLALLSSRDNSALNNSIFPAKRDKIKDLDKEGSFIPICTKNVFLKYYSNDVKETLKWNREDRKYYLAEIKKTLKEYLGDE